MSEKTWNGGSVEEAMRLARKRVDILITQGAALCDECNGDGGTMHGVCIQCRGAGVLLPPDGLPRLPTRAEASAAAEVLFRCNGHDLSTWTGDEWPSDEFSRAIKLLRKDSNG